MPRFLIQSKATGRFMAPDDGGQPAWFVCLRDAGAGVFSDPERGFQLVRDHCDAEDEPVLVDLDRLGTSYDYAKVL